MYINYIMSLKIIWRSTVFLLTILFIYLAFPILIVPSSLPAIKVLFVEQNETIDYNQPISNIKKPSSITNPQIHELNIETALTFKQKISVLKKIHKQGIDMILIKN